MSQEKAQLIAPLGHFTVPGLNVAGVVTASSFSGNCTGTASSIAQGTNVVVGVMTASSFAGDVFGNAAGLSTTTSGLKLGIVTATSFAGNFTGIGSGLTGTPNIVAGLVTATQFIGNTPGLAAGISGGKNLNAGIITSTSFSGNLTGNATGLSTTTAHVNLGIVTATSYHGSGANLDGVSSGPVAQQVVNANSGTTTVDLSSGNLIYFNQSSDTTVSFANTEGNTDVVYFVRVKDATVTARAITWPSTVSWNGGSAPTLVNANDTAEAQIFKLTTRDNGVTWYGAEVFSNPGGGILFSWGGSWSGAAHGGGGYGILGHNNATQYSSPTQIGTEAGWSINASTSGEDNKSFAGEYHNGSLKTDGTLWVWGYNNRGQLGQNNTTDYSSPVQVPGTNWATLQYGGWNCSGIHAIKTDGTLWVWGYNNAGQLGLSNKTSYSSPAQVPGTTWKSCLRSGNLAAATKTDGTLWSWGYNGNGGLGHNNRTEYNSPVQVGSGTDWNYVTGGSDNHLFAIKTNGTLWHSGGWNGSAQNETVNRSSPVQITTATNWVKVNATGGAASTLALRSDGTLYGWGHNFYGTLGQNSINSPDSNRISSPTQIPGTTWNDITGWYTTAVATKSDGTMWAWGAGSYLDISQAGVSPAHTQYSSPTQIPGAWSQGLGGASMIMSWKA